MAEITRTGYLSGQNTGTANVALTNPVGAGAGNSMLLVLTVSAVSASLSNLAGWEVLVDRTYNSRRTYLLTRVHAASYPNIVLSSAATAGWAMMSFAPASGHELDAWTVGPVWDRPTSGGGSVPNTTMLSTSGRANSLAVAITAETSTGPESEAQVSFTGAGWAKWFYADSDPAADVSAVHWVGYKSVGAAATGDVITAWPNSSNNSVGVQAVLGQAASGPTPTGNLDTVGIYANTGTSLTVGMRQVGGGAVSVVAKLGGTEVARGPVPFTSGRGNATLSGLASGTSYDISFEVDGLAQTDVSARGATLRSGASDFSFVAGSCMFTGSTHPVFDAIAAEGADFWSLQGDAHYEDATTAQDWWAGMVRGLNAWRGITKKLVTRWTPDNHDTIRTTPLGGGAPELPPIWKQMAGAAGWGSADSVGQAWQNGRVLFIQADLRSARDNYQTVAEPRKLLGDEQTAWFKALLADAEADPSIGLVVWFDNWIGLRQSSGRWGDYTAAYTDLNDTIQASDWLRTHTVLIGGDSHNLWADSGARSWPEAAFPGIPSLNMSGYNRASPAESFFIPDIANESIQASGAEEDWGGYSLVKIEDDGSDITFKWSAVRVHSGGARDVMSTWSKTFGASTIPQQWVALYANGKPVEALYHDGAQIWP